MGYIYYMYNIGIEIIFRSDLIMLNTKMIGYQNYICLNMKAASNGYTP